MITEREVEILEYIKTGKSASRLDVINRFDPRIRCNETDALLTNLVATNAIEKSVAGFRITGRGIKELSAYYAAREKYAQQERENRFNRKIQILNLVIPVVTFFLGIAVEHFCSISALLARLFSHF